MEEECTVPISSERDIVLARQKGRALATELGFSVGNATLVATAISELARNIVAYIDGFGHGEEAAGAAKIAASIFQNATDEPIISLVEECHRALRATRGVVLSAASVDFTHGMMTWLGVGNVVGGLARVVPRGSNYPEMLLLRGGVVGKQLPPLQAAVLPVFQGDALFFSTDGINGRYVETVSPRENPQRAADRILQKFHTATDDALI